MKEFEDRWLFQIVEYKHRVISNYYFHAILYFSLLYFVSWIQLFHQISPSIFSFLFTSFTFTCETTKTCKIFQIDDFSVSMCVYNIWLYILCVGKKNLHICRKRKKTLKEVRWIEIFSVDNFMEFTIFKKKTCVEGTKK